tara:strand:+ start:84 stop:386 length:303 start_codon:yes stop_codon:yes gene_type:complete
MKIKIKRNTVLIGLLGAILLYCILNDFSIREGMTKNKKNQGLFGKVAGAVGGAITNVASTTGKVAANTLKGTAKLAGKGVNVVKTSGKIFTNQANRKPSV